MQKTIFFTLVLFSFVACDLDKLEPAQTKAFMKFYGDIGNTEGVDLLKLDDGYLLLGNNTYENLETAILIKTDLNGNTIWSAFFENISASALAKNNNSYFIVGDSINNSNLLNTRMSLIKTDLDGENHQYTSLGLTNVPYHGTGITISRSGQVVVCGDINGLLSGTDTTFIYGYDTELIPAWAAVRPWFYTGDKRSSSNTIIEDIDSNFVFTSMYGSGNRIEAIKVAEDSPDATEVLDLFDDNVSTVNLGDFSDYLNNDYVTVQTVTNTNNTNKTALALGVFSSLPENPIIFGHTDINYVAGTVIKASDGDIVVLGSIDKRTSDPKADPRSDFDFYITKVGFDGSVSSISGFTNIIGGTGEETAAAIVQAEDKGFVFLGTMENTNDVKTMVLVKVDINGELIN